MDPNKCLEELLEVAYSIIKEENSQTSEAIDLAEKVLDLNQWILNKGFLPKQWQR